jgi:hypothetical protein
MWDKKNALECYVDEAGIRISADGWDIPLEDAEKFANAILECVRQFRIKKCAEVK